MLRLLSRVALVLALAACSQQTSTSSGDKRDPAPLPTPLTLNAPASDVPANVAAFSGLYEGDWGGWLNGKLAVVSVEADGRVTAIYGIGENPGEWRAAYSEHKGSVVGDVLTLDRFGNGAVASYTMREDGDLDGRYVRDGNTSIGVFKRKP